MTNTSDMLQVVPGKFGDLNMARRDGSWSVYVFYFQSAGWIVVFTVGLCVALYGFSEKFYSASIHYDQNVANYKKLCGSNSGQMPMIVIQIRGLGIILESIHSYSCYR